MTTALSDTTVRVIELYRAGERPIDIATKLKMTYRAVSGAVHRAKKAGYLDAEVFTPPPRDSRWFRRIVERHDVKTGGIERTIASSTMTREVADWLCQEVIDGGHGTVSAYLLELAIEEFYRQNG